MRAGQLFVLDALLVLGFAAIGRRSHAEGFTLLGLLGTAAPFWAGLVLGWAYTRARGGWPTTVRTSVPMWLLTVAVGHAVRMLTGVGTAASFIAVSLVALGILLLLPRAVLERTSR